MYNYCTFTFNQLGEKFLYLSAYCKSKSCLLDIGYVVYAS